MWGNETNPKTLFNLHSKPVEAGEMYGVEKARYR